jgi:hypothetical protein
VQVNGCYLRINEMLMQRSYCVLDGDGWDRRIADLRDARSFFLHSGCERRVSLWLLVVQSKPFSFSSSRIVYLSVKVSLSL